MASFTTKTGADEERHDGCGRTKSDEGRRKRTVGLDWILASSKVVRVCGGCSGRMEKKRGRGWRRLQRKGKRKKMVGGWC
uniref:Uncharacterized protein n=1 Tax=Cucumis sativus TaxID=3659 RepID=A0A0A0LNQ4_CUCSA